MWIGMTRIQGMLSFMMWHLLVQTTEEFRLKETKTNLLRLGEKTKFVFSQLKDIGNEIHLLWISKWWLLKNHTNKNKFYKKIGHFGEKEVARPIQFQKSICGRSFNIWWDVVQEVITAKVFISREKSIRWTEKDGRWKVITDEINKITTSYIKRN